MNNTQVILNLWASNCWEWLVKYSGIVALVLTVVFGLANYARTGRLAKLHLDPGLTCHPILSESTNTAPPPTGLSRWPKPLKVIVANNGLLLARAVDIKIRVDTFSLKDGSESVKVHLPNEAFPESVELLKALDVGDSKSYGVGGSLGVIRVVRVALSYSREADGRRYEKQFRFVADDDHVLSDEEFTGHRLAKVILPKLQK